MNIYRHGDLSFKQIDCLPENIKDVTIKNSHVLALGEHTGHKHVITAPKEGTVKWSTATDGRDILVMAPKEDTVKWYTTTDGRDILVIGDTALLTHKEHKTITFAPGIYEMGREREYNYFSLATQRVID